MALLISVLLLASTPQVQEITFDVFSLKRSDLPDDFPLQVLDVGFAVLKLKVRNGSAGTWTFHPAALQVFERGGKKLDRAIPTEITPKLMKFYRGGQLDISGEGYYGRRPTPQEQQRVPTVEPGARTGTVSATLGSRLRAILEHYEVKPVDVAPGQTWEGFLYLKSKKTGSRLSGSSLRFENQVSIEIP